LHLHTYCAPARAGLVTPARTPSHEGRLHGKLSAGLTRSAIVREPLAFGNVERRGAARVLRLVRVLVVIPRFLNLTFPDVGKEKSAAILIIADL